MSLPAPPLQSPSNLGGNRSAGVNVAVVTLQEAGSAPEECHRLGLLLMSHSSMPSTVNRYKLSLKRKWLKKRHKLHFNCLKIGSEHINDTLPHVFFFPGTPEFCPRALLLL
ncbi:hypothetical protein JZ751_015055 [Albula glossodonta]|uniref:Uncharacterized protein n=1 Tax=Albula glossodonta TaxID=121402 RepID=A0A8T2NZL5_9TELE|nr:hypothetical protein JZ751_015055 [Albula glossodonta]